MQRVTYQSYAVMVYSCTKANETGGEREPRDLRSFSLARLHRIHHSGTFFIVADKKMHQALCIRLHLLMPSIYLYM